MQTKENKPEKAENLKLHKALTIVGIVLCVILVPVLIANCTLIVKSLVNKDEVPDIGGLMPFIVVTESMDPFIKSGDIIITKDIDTEDIEPGMIISFFDPASRTGTAVVTHRVMYIIDDGDGTVSFKTAGDCNVKNSGGNAENEKGYDKKPVPAEKVIGVYTGVRIPKAGSMALFMQTTPGLILCVMVPLILLVGYDIIRRKLYEKNKEDDVAVLMAELEELRKLQNTEGKVQPEAETQTEAQSETPVEAQEEPQSETQEETQSESQTEKDEKEDQQPE